MGYDHQGTHRTKVGRLQGRLKASQAAGPVPPNPFLFEKRNGSETRTCNTQTESVATNLLIYSTDIRSTDIALLTSNTSASRGERGDTITSTIMRRGSGVVPFPEKPAAIAWDQMMSSNGHAIGQSIHAGACQWVGGRHACTTMKRKDERTDSISDQWGC